MSGLKTWGLEVEGFEYIINFWAPPGKETKWGEGEAPSLACVQAPALTLFRAYPKDTWRSSYMHASDSVPQYRRWWDCDLLLRLSL